MATTKDRFVVIRDSKERELAGASLVHVRGVDGWSSRDHHEL